MILVTGGTGFVGSELILQLLHTGSKVRAIRRSSSVIPLLLQDKNIEWVIADLLDYDDLCQAFNDVEQVYHCAAYLSFDPSEKKKLISINTAITANVVNSCLQHTGIRLVHVSSIAALGDGKPGQLITENDHWEFSNTQNGYAISKYEAEMEVWRGIAEGLDAVIINPSLIIGKNAGIKGSGELFETVRKGLRFYTDGSCGLVDAEDVAGIMIRLMNNPVSEERFIINAENLSYQEIFSAAARFMGMNPPKIKARPWMLGITWRVCKLVSLLTGKQQGITKDTASSAFKKQNYSNKKIRTLFPEFKFKPVEQSIKEICAALKP